MKYLLGIIPLLLVVALITFRKITIYEYQQGLLYSRGKFIKILEPGNHWYYRPLQSVNKVDIRIMNVTIQGQEVLSLDNIGIKISLAASYKIVDPNIAINKVLNYQEALYLQIQLNLREIIGSKEVDDLLVKRKEIAEILNEKSKIQAVEIGIDLLSVSIKDIMFSSELRNIFSQVLYAKKEGLASLERARGEGATLRNLANVAKVLDNNPNLMQLRLYQVLEKNSGNTIVIMSPDGKVMNQLTDKNH
jgi:regulator of protease activity HflC (stomatin/prohibitin superfamily)